MTINRHFLNETGSATMDLLLPGLRGLFGRIYKDLPKGAELDFEAKPNGDLEFSYYDGRRKFRLSEICLTKTEMDSKAISKDKGLFKRRFDAAFARWVGEK